MVDFFQTFFLSEECAGRAYQQNHKQHNQLRLPHKFQLKKAARNSANKTTIKYNTEVYLTINQTISQKQYSINRKRCFFGLDCYRPCTNQPNF